MGQSPCAPGRASAAVGGGGCCCCSSEDWDPGGQTCAAQKTALVLHALCPQEKRPNNSEGDVNFLLVALNMYSRCVPV